MNPLMNLTNCAVGTLRLLMDDAYGKEDYHRARMNEAIEDQNRIAKEADRRGVLL